MKVLIERFQYEDKQTLGLLYVLNDDKAVEYMCGTLELGWKENQRSISCIPVGDYKVTKRTSPKYGEHFHILDVPDRDYILIHAGNFYSDIRGCVLVGEDFKDLNKDGLLDVTNSRDTMTQLLKVLPETFDLNINDINQVIING